jgi:2,4-dienoyl-CoA reductase [(3E)-enoyl-CoA-producing], peroxisomal
MDSQSASQIFRQDIFKDKVMVLTGGTSKMLFQPALDFMKLGGKVALLSRKLDQLNIVADKLMKESNNNTFAKGYQIDLKKAIDKDYSELIDNILKDFGRIDVLVNGAAGNFLAEAEKLSLNAFKTVIEIDTIGTFLMSKHVYAKWMKNNGGSIINISASLHHLGTLLNSHASAAKAAIDAITKTLALEWGPKGVRVNGIAPGMIEGTEGFERLIDLNNANNANNANKESINKSNQSKDNVVKYDLNFFKKYIPLQRYGSRNDVSKGVLFLSSELSAYVTGQTLLVDGGALAITPNWLVHFPEFIKSWSAKF